MMMDETHRRAFPRISVRLLRPEVVGLTISDTEYALLPGDVAAAQFALRVATDMSQPPAENDVSADQDPMVASVWRARAFIRDNLAQAAAELVAWHRSGKLAEGVIRQAGAILEEEYPEDFIQEAENMVVKESLHEIACSAGSSTKAAEQNA